jgi:nucleoside-diphosphate-sugar epimerase
MNKVLVTGGVEYLGSVVCEKLLDCHVAWIQDKRSVCKMVRFATAKS